MSAPIVSMVENATATATFDVDGAAIVKSTRTGGRQQALVESIRAKFARVMATTGGDRKSAKEAVARDKKRLAGILWSGRFQRRANGAIIEHSGLLCADLDALGESLPSIHAQLLASPYLWALFVSPTGDGLKAVFRVRPDADLHVASFRAVEKHVMELTDVQIDGSRKDVAGLCFVSLDPQVYNNPDARELSPLVEAEKPRSASASKGGTPDLRTRQRIAADLLGNIGWTSGTRGLVACPGKQFHTTGDNERDCEIHLDGAPTLHCFHDHCQGFRDGLNHELRSRIGKAESERHSHPRNGAPEAWPEPDPLPPEHPPVDPFSYALLPRNFEPFVRDVCERMQCPPDYVAVGLMVGAGNLIGRKVGIHPKRHDDWLELCNLWGAVVGPPSVMKSPALAEALYPPNKLVAEAIQKHEAERKEFATDALLVKARKSKQAKEIAEALNDGGEDAALAVAKKMSASARPEPKEKRYIANDATMEKLGELLNETPNGLLCYRDELAGWLRSMDKDGHENDRAFALECWSGKSAYTYDRIQRGTIRVEVAMFGVLGGIQPGVLAEYVSASVRGGTGNDGLIQRFSLLVWPEFDGDFRNIDRWPDKAAKDAVMEVFRALDNLTAESVGAVSDFDGVPCLRFNAEAQELFDRWREGFENGLRSSEEHPSLVSHFAKYRKLVPAMALLIHLCDGGTGPVPADALTKAVAWHAYLASHARKVYGGVTDSGAGAVRQIVRRIHKHDLKDGFTLRDVYINGWSGLPDAHTAGAGVAMLIRLGWLREETRAAGDTGGRPTVIHRINSKFASAYKSETSKPTKPPSEGEKGGSDGFAGSISRANGEIEASYEAENEAASEEVLSL